MFTKIVIWWCEKGFVFTKIVIFGIYIYKKIGISRSSTRLPSGFNRRVNRRVGNGVNNRHEVGSVLLVFSHVPVTSSSWVTAFSIIINRELGSFLKFFLRVVKLFKTRSTTNYWSVRGDLYMGIPGTSRR